MSITYAKVTQEVLNLLSAVLGSSASIADSNYSATPDVTTVTGPDFLASHVQDAIVAAQGEIVEAIAMTPLHPERARFADVTISLANLTDIPRTGSSTGKLIIGVPSWVKDATSGKALLPMNLDAVRSFNEFSSTVYSGFTAYWYAINSGRIEHTRTNVVLGVCVYERPTSLNSTLDLDDHQEGGLIQGAVAKLALKENLFEGLFQGANSAWQAHLAGIRNYGNADLYGRAQAAPSSI